METFLTDLLLAYSDTERSFVSIYTYGNLANMIPLDVGYYIGNTKTSINN